jgi:hypothetical protein
MGFKNLNMISSQQYRGYNITYYSMQGTTTICGDFGLLKRFKELGEQKGLERAKIYIDKLLNF